MTLTITVHSARTPIYATFAFAVGCMLMVAASPALAQTSVPEYHVTRMGEMLETMYPGNLFLSSQMRGLNENGDAVGEVNLDNGDQFPWIYTVEHGIVPLPLIPGFPRAAVKDISDRDSNGEVMIVGGGVLSNEYPGTAALWRFSTVTGQVLETRDIGILPEYTETIVVGINNAGSAIGYAKRMAGSIPQSTPITYDAGTGALEALDFPVWPAAINNHGQIVGGRYRGDLFGNYEDLGIPPDCTSSTLEGINDLGWVTGRAGRPWTNGAGSFVASITRFTNSGWHVLPAGSPWDSGFDINIHGDLSTGIGQGWEGVVYLDALQELRGLGTMVAPEFYREVEPRGAYAINDNGQIVARSGHAILLTPLGVMIVPGDVNGDVQVNLDDHCAWLANPIDLNGDGLVNAEDEKWLIERLAVFGFIVQDCNQNGIDDHCDITSGFSNDCDGNGVPDECQDDCNGDGVPDVCEPDCNGNGIPDPCDIAAGTSDDCNGNGIPDECDRLGGSTRVTSVLNPPLVLIAGEAHEKSIRVHDVGMVGDVDFEIDIEQRIGDLTVLLSHNGATITLIERPGHPQVFLGNGQLGYDIVLDDEGTGGAIEDQGNFGSPFEPIVSPPSYTPNDPLSTFDGMPMEGTWTVTIITEPGWHPAHRFYEWGLAISVDPKAVAQCGCYADCDQSTGPGVLDIFDFLCFQDAFVNADPYACDCDTTTGNGVCDIFDFLCFQDAFVAGCP